MGAPAWLERAQRRARLVKCHERSGGVGATLSRLETLFAECHVSLEHATRQPMHWCDKRGSAQYCTFQIPLTARQQNRFELAVNLVVARVAVD